jgi:hypothetical protein
MGGPENPVDNLLVDIGAALLDGQQILLDIS